MNRIIEDVNLINFPMGILAVFCFDFLKYLFIFIYGLQFAS